MKLIVIGSNSSGNGYALDDGKEILLLEAGCKYKDMSKAIGHRIDEVVGCITTHRHGDHFKYALEYSRNGIPIFGCMDAVDSQPFEYGKKYVLETEKTTHLGNYDIVPFNNYHDVEIYGYLIRHPQMGIMLFSTDSYKIGLTIRGINHFLIEANYEDSLLKENVHKGRISKAQSDRIMLSHMSLNYCINYLRECEADKTAKTITLCHLSDRNSEQEMFRNAVAGAFGVPTFIATKRTIVELSGL